ncbi:unnamed protein product [Triticum turgidum subsp. durum]|uniref:Alcohol dehydrogenase-like N-terminal domain-containing protein n=1 Tax=Triticum turgidum subsp. durum TaxID=4567 RepID=A0A9R0WPQ0_TRITD|nr:unnamed protein product [Triticum turgidum subsp. durum]
MATPRTMRAVQYDKYGGGAEGLKHVEVPVPSPKKGEVLLKMEAASINPIDWKIQKGMLRPFLPGKFPFTPVGDLAGEVVELGSGVTNFKPGDKVISISFPSGGGLAEYAVAPASLTVARPPEEFRRTPCVQHGANNLMARQQLDDIGMASLRRQSVNVAGGKAMRRCYL